MSNRTSEKYARIETMKWLYAQKAYSDSDMAEVLDTNRSTVNRDRRFMEEELNMQFILVEHGKYRLDPQSIMERILLSQEEALALYIAGRRLQQQTRTSQTAVANALHKLSHAFKRPLQSEMVRAAEEVLSQEQDHRQVGILQKILQAWIDKRQLEITHQTLQGNERKYLVEPYQIEPSIWGDGLYLIGHSSFHQGIATFKVGRITRATVTTVPFAPPETFDVHQLLQHAWGIWQTGQDPILVRLKFSEWATPRLKETLWHPAQTIQDLSEGGCIWSAEVAEWQEMVPWIRGWGADVEVLEPEDLRERLKKNVQHLAKKYSVLSMQKLPYQVPYAKTNPEDRNNIHLLLYHLIDVGQTTLVLWQEVLTDKTRQDISDLLGLTVQDTGQFLAFLGGLHDIGKASPAYQKKYAPEWLKKELNKVGLILNDIHMPDKVQNPKTPHATISMWFLKTYLVDNFSIKKKFTKQIATALGGHHGAWPSVGDDEGIDDSYYPQWNTVRLDLAWHLQSVFKPPQHIETPPKNQLNMFITWFSGLVSVADWLGSRNTECFGFVQRPLPTRQYAEQSYQKALTSLQDLGWIGWQPKNKLPTFAQAFSYLNFDSPRPVQQQVIDLAQHCQLPTLLILEAPTGLGKTETAIYLADRWLQQNKGRGLYIAMPTQATSNQMFGRFQQYLQHRYPDELVNTHLAHGQANWSEQFKEIELHTIGDDKITGVAAMSWFKPRKRTLLAPFGVGTVDQTMMSVLQTKHFFVRLFALTHKVVIFDEVHAYDTFMSTIFHQLLSWLQAIGTSVIILSATLPTVTRQKLVEAYTGQTWQSPEPNYPAVTIAEQNKATQYAPLSPPDTYELKLDTSLGKDVAEIVTYVQGFLEKGGCLAIVCNTVNRAQEIYRALQNGNLGLPDDDLILFHARFPPIWRKKIENKVLCKFGKPSSTTNRPEKAIIVATQVIEQSLDLDFDTMITDLAPIDLILQRAGRVHRHTRSQRHHPRQLIITQPSRDENGLPEFDNDKYVYEPYILLRSLWVLQRPSITIPTDTTELIEFVYAEAPDPLPNETWQNAIEQAHGKMQQAQKKAQVKADNQLIPDAQNRFLLANPLNQLEEDNPELHQTFRAQTRDIELSLTLVCLQKKGDNLYMEVGDGKTKLVYPNSEINHQTAKHLLQNSINVQRRDLVKAMLAEEIPESWETQASLRYCRLVIFRNGRFSVPNTNLILQLSQQYGLEIIKSEGI